MIHYITQVLLFQTLFLVIYDFILKKETFFQWNRAYLIVTSVFAYLIPLIRIDKVSSYVQQTIAVELPTVFISPETIFLDAVNLNDTSGNFFGAHYIYYIGIFIASLLFLFKLNQINKKIRENKVLKTKAYKLVLLSNQTKAFSFFKYLFLGDSIPKNKHKHIIEHELIHIKQKHSIDLLLFELQRIIFWFNPFSYLYQNRISALHEYIADSKTIDETDKSSFFENLLSQTFQIEKFSFVNNFYKKSLLKKRIIMATKNKSKHILKLKYLLLLPILGIMFIYTSGFSTFNKVDDKIEHLNKINTSNFDKVYDTIKPNGKISSVTEIEQQTYPFAIVDKVPAYKGCEHLESKKIKQCTVDKITKFVSDNFNTKIANNLGLKSGFKRISVQFEIDTSGKVVDVKVRAPHPKLKEEAIRLITSMSQFTPGEYEGKPINVRYSLPINFVVEGSSKIKSENEQEILPFSIIDKVPAYKGCEHLESKKIKQCTVDKITKFVSDNFNTKIANNLGLKPGFKRISVQFKIDASGKVVNVKTRAPHPKLKEEAIRLITSMPQFTPGESDGKPVNVRYNLPISFKVEKPNSKNKK
jgi:hypothetical protein